MKRNPTAAETRLRSDSLIPNNLPCSASEPKLLISVMYGDHSVAVVNTAYKANIMMRLVYDGKEACQRVVAPVPAREIPMRILGLNFCARIPPMA